MLEFISSYPKLFLGVFTPALLATGYFYRARKEKNDNLKKALYILLEIWHRMAVLYRKDFDSYFDAITAEIIKKVPEEEFTEEQRKASKEYFTPILMNTVQTAAFSDIEHYQDSFDEAVKLIAINDPFFAYDIGSGGKTKIFLKTLDSYLEDALQPLENEGGDGLVLSNTLKDQLSSHASLDALSDLEKDINRLSFRVGIITYIKSFSVIRKRKERLQGFTKKEVSELVDSVLFPVIEEFNKQRQATP